MSAQGLLDCTPREQFTDFELTDLNITRLLRKLGEKEE
jgi:hypothetical protein